MAINGVIGFAIGYLVASRFGDGDGALRSGLVSAVLTAAIAGASYERAESSEETGEDDAPA